MGKAVSSDGDGVKDVVAELLGDPELAAPQPIMVERYDTERASHEPESMDVGFVRRPPAVECNAELVRAAGRRKELGFVDAERLIELVDRRDRRLADPDYPDLVGLDQRHRHAGKAEAAQCGRGHPSRRAAADDDDPALRCVTHQSIFRPRHRRRRSAAGAA